MRLNSRGRYHFSLDEGLLIQDTYRQKYTDSQFAAVLGLSYETWIHKIHGRTGCGPTELRRIYDLLSSIQPFSFLNLQEQHPRVIDARLEKELQRTEDAFRKTYTAQTHLGKKKMIKRMRNFRYQLNSDFGKTR